MTEILEGTIEPAEPRRNKHGYMFFDQLRFGDMAGTERMLPKICAGGAVATDRRPTPHWTIRSSGGP
ncbi:MAG: hypothetical protein H0W71_02935 [Sphingomonas sp.]|nr:hypothetical protein [Sphingomonas sp.]